MEEKKRFRAVARLRCIMNRSAKAVKAKPRARAPKKYIGELNPRIDGMRVTGMRKRE
jgi:hypothetical protein